MKRILLILTGGTIASVETDQGLRPGISEEELRESLSGITDFCQVEILSLLNVDSTNIQPEHWQMIVQAIEKRFDCYDGFVITHGTDTMAYTAAALSYMIQNPHKPVVITGAQKPLVKTVTDARKNLRDSFRFACEENVNGVFLIFNGEVILGTRARKVRSKSFNAFDSINYPIVAFIDNDRVIRYVDISGDSGPTSFYSHLVPKVFLLKLVPGITPDILDYISDHYEAVVIESYGVGGIPFADERNFLEKLECLNRKKCIVVIATQVMLEGSDVELYEVGFRAMSRYHLLQAYDMTTEAIVAKLMWLLGKCNDFESFQREFYTPVSCDLLRCE